jgi:pimeloyl-ACP methyl ester carboxylesterase
MHPMIPPVRTFRLQGSPALEVAEQGAAAGTPVIALHGVTDSWRSFQPLLPHLPSTLRFIAPTQRGHGDSDKPAQGYAPRDFAADVLRLMDTLDLPRAVIVGHSMGGMHAQRFAIDHPDRVAGLVLAGTAAAFAVDPELVAFWRDHVAALVDPVDAGFAREFQLGTLAQPVPPGFVDLAVAESLKVPARVWRAAFDGFMTTDLRPELGRIAAPTLVVRGAKDTICGEAEQRRLVDSIPGARLITYVQAGHAMHWEEPRRFALDLVAFLAAVDPTAARAAPQAATAL